MKFTLIGSAPAGIKPSTSGLFINEVYHRQLVLKSWVLKAPEVLQSQSGGGDLLLTKLKKETLSLDF